MGWTYPGSMANLDFETRTLDCEIRLLLGLPMADTASDFLGGFAEEVTDRDKETVDLTNEIKELTRELRLANATIDRLTKKET